MEVKEHPGFIFAMQPDYGVGNNASRRRFWSAGLRANSRYQGRLYQDHCEASFDGGDAFLSAVLNAQESGMNITHFIMLHNDVVPESGWIDILMEEILACGADLLSVAMPIKDLKGLTSTAIDSLDDPYEVERRITMTELYRLPPTFGIKDIPGYGDRRLLANTGCFVMDVTKPWFSAVWKEEELASYKLRKMAACQANPSHKAELLAIADSLKDLEPVPGKLKLTNTSTDRVGRRADGQWQGEHSPSDWGLSRIIQNMGGKVMVTRKLACLHMGQLPYDNQKPWGDEETDMALAHKWDGVPLLPKIKEAAPV